MPKGEKEPEKNIYQPVDGTWPIYSVVVSTKETGFHVAVSSKFSTLSFWETCNFFNPIPFDILPILLEVLQHVKQQCVL